jgi:hypothetical protein
VEYNGKKFSFKSRQFQKILQGGHHWPTLSKIQWNLVRLVVYANIKKTN